MTCDNVIQIRFNRSQVFAYVLGIHVARHLRFRHKLRIKIYEILRRILFDFSKQLIQIQQRDLVISEAQ